MVGRAEASLLRVTTRRPDMVLIGASLILVVVIPLVLRWSPSRRGGDGPSSSSCDDEGLDAGTVGRRLGGSQTGCSRPRTPPLTLARIVDSFVVIYHSVDDHRRRLIRPSSDVTCTQWGLFTRLAKLFPSFILLAPGFLFLAL